MGSKKPKRDIFDRIAVELFTPGGRYYGNKPVDRLTLGDTGFGWGREPLADYVRTRFRELSKAAQRDAIKKSKRKAK